MRFVVGIVGLIGSAAIVLWFYQTQLAGSTDNDGAKQQEQRLRQDIERVENDLQKRFETQLESIDKP